MFNLGIVASSQHAPAAGGGGVEFIASNTEVSQGNGSEPAHTNGDVLYFMGIRRDRDATPSIALPSGYTNIVDGESGIGSHAIGYRFAYKIGNGTPASFTNLSIGEAIYSFMAFRNASTSPTYDFAIDDGNGLVMEAPSITGIADGGLRLLLSGNRAGTIGDVTHTLTTMWDVTAEGTNAWKCDADGQRSTVVVNDAEVYPAVELLPGTGSSTKTWVAFQVIINPA